MKQIQFETAKARLIFILPPDDSIGHKISGTNYLCFKFYDETGIGEPTEFWQAYPPRLYRNWKLQGFVSELTDEQKEGVVDSYHNEVGSLHVDYSTNTYQFIKVSKSFASLLTSLNVLLVNPYGESPNEDDYDKYPLPICFDANEEAGAFYRRKCIIEDDWQTAQKNVGNWILLTCNK